MYPYCVYPPQEVKLGEYRYSTRGRHYNFDRKIVFLRKGGDPSTIRARAFVKLEDKEWIGPVTTHPGNEIDVEMLSCAEKIEGYRRARRGETFEDVPDRPLSALSVEKQDAILQRLEPFGNWVLSIAHEGQVDGRYEKIGKLSLWSKTPDKPKTTPAPTVGPIILRTGHRLIGTYRYSTIALDGPCNRKIAFIRRGMDASTIYAEAYVKLEEARWTGPVSRIQGDTINVETLSSQEALERFLKERAGETLVEVKDYALSELPLQVQDALIRAIVDKHVWKLGIVTTTGKEYEVVERLSLYRS